MNVIINSVAVFCYLQAINVGIKKKKKVQRMQTKNEKNELCTEFVLHSAQWGLTAIVLMTE